jgi:hypothetical protein
MEEKNEWKKDSDDLMIVHTERERNIGQSTWR